MKRAGITLLLIVCLAGTFAGGARAGLVLDTDPALSQLPIERWAGESKVDLPEVTVEVEAGACPGSATAVACAGSLHDGRYDLTFNLARLDELGLEYYKSTFFHELGHVADYAYFGRDVQGRVKVAFGYPADRGWHEERRHNPEQGVIGPSPAEWSAEAFTWCAWGPDLPVENVSYGFPFSYSQITGICQLFTDRITGDRFEVLSPPPVVSPCVPNCSVVVKPRSRFVSKARFKAGSARFVLRVGQRKVRSNSRCRRLVRVGGQRIRIYTCGQRVIVKVLRRKAVRIRFWGSPHRSSATDPPLSLPARGSTDIEVQNPSEGSLPLAAWASQSAVPTPDIAVLTTYGRCVDQSVVCGSAGYSSNFLWIDLEKFDDPGFEAVNYRAWFFRELAVFADRSFLAPGLRQKISSLLGYESDRPWDERKPTAATVASPFEFFQEAYATCAWGGDRPPTSVSTETPHTFGLVAPICQLLDRVSS